MKFKMVSMVICLYLLSGISFGKIRIRTLLTEDKAQGAEKADGEEVAAPAPPGAIGKEVPILPPKIKSRTLLTENKFQGEEVAAPPVSQKIKSRALLSEDTSQGEETPEADGETPSADGEEGSTPPAEGGEEGTTPPAGEGESGEEGTTPPAEGEGGEESSDSPEGNGEEGGESQSLTTGGAAVGEEAASQSLAAKKESGSAGGVPSGGVIDLVKNCGAKQNSDITQQLMKAWTDACACTTATKIVIPEGAYNLGAINLCGPCKAPITFNLDGTLKAPEDPSAFKKLEWVVFEEVEFLTVTGTGVFDGQGPKAWASSGCEKKSHCRLPINIRFDKVKHALITGVTSKDSKNFNVNLYGCDNVTFSKFKVITAPGSMNTDGIHVGGSSNVKILDTDLKCGDDCVSIGDGTTNMEVSKVTCGPGHGISIGSLGKYQNEDPVTGIHVKDCTLENTDNGARIKAWPGMYPCTVDDILFEGITMTNVSNPVILDMCYCPHGSCKKGEASKVKMSNVIFRNIKGSSARPEAVQILCSPGMCQNIELCNIDLTYEGPPDDKDNFSSICSNVKPKITKPLNPPGSTCG